MAITFVGKATAGKVGATSGTSTISLSSGLTGGSRDHVQAGDLVIAIFATGSAADRTLSITDGTTDYTLTGNELYANDTEDTNLRVGRKFMGVTPDGSVTFGPTGNTADAGTMGVMVFSGVDATTPLDVAVTEATGTNTGAANPPSITPATAGAYVVAIGATGCNTGATAFTSSDLTDFASVAQLDTEESALGFGYIAWSGSGAVDPAAFTGNTGTSNSWCAMSIALRPAAAAGVTGTLAATETADTASLAGDVIVQGTIGATEGSDSASIAGDVLIFGALAATEGAGDSAALAGKVFVAGALAASEAADTASLAGDVLIQGTLAATEGSDTASLSGASVVIGALAATEGVDTAAFTSAVPVVPRVPTVSRGPHGYGLSRARPSHTGTTRPRHVSTGIR